IPVNCRIHEPYNSTGFIDQSQDRTTRRTPPIRVHHAGHAAHYMLHLIHFLLWSGAYLPRMPVERTHKHTTTTSMTHGQDGPRLACGSGL
uniref:Superoxide dismutase n=1 Tax=Mesocestoides corti TaxID=53468 RepID=A0A5K3G099_MESCO